MDSGYDYPLLGKVREHYSRLGGDASDARLYACQHLLEPQLRMFKAFIEFGFKPGNIFVLGKAYSSNAGIVKELEALGINASQPTFSGASFDREHDRNCALFAEMGKKSSGKKIVVLDDGGALIHAFRGIEGVIFAVEQTSSGFRRLENIDLPFPVYNVARSDTKLLQESPIIGRLIFERVTSYMHSNNLISPKIHIVGMGPIGRSVLMILLQEGYDAKGYDKGVSKVQFLSNLVGERPDIVIGATGASLFNERDVELLRGSHTYHFISVSSSDREFPVASFRKHGGKTHDDVRHGNLVFVNNGFPITFKGNRLESTPLEMEKTMALLMGSVMHGISRGSKGHGFVQVPKELEELINK